MSDSPSIRSEVASSQTSRTDDEIRGNEVMLPNASSTDERKATGGGLSLETEEKASPRKKTPFPSPPRIPLSPTKTDSPNENVSPQLSGRSRDVLRVVEEVIRSVDARTRHSVHDLCVKIINDKIILEGTCQSFHVKQLAQQAAMKNERSLEVENRISVISS